ncbi:DUF6461 domain-containing protein [Micromonospora sp. CP22]|uniref:DUF6461 domain-containing protein n=1 Tax=Micromonospora sp. CP22 TaxID=2580517 RepID=UPI0012BC845E|nr:DUF6461 domain-containing protein [Micromonospora sp. CP22]MTK05190.1 hypothetical protein [Micromonospora sp. CP22]
MSETTAGQWAWAEDPCLVMWCVTFTRAITAPDVLARYGADPRVARLLDRDEANSLYAETAQEGSMLRAGSLGMWSFCFEEHGITSAMSGTCATLSEGTETLSVLRGADGMNGFAHWRDGRRVERFEPGMTVTKPQPPHPWWDAVEVHLATRPSPHSRLVPVLEVVAAHIGAALDSRTVDGPLLTAALVTSGESLSRSRPRTTSRRPPGRLLPSPASVSPRAQTEGRMEGRE